MAKLTVSRLFEAGRVLKAFQDAKIDNVESFITFLSDFSENVIRALRGQLTFKDNFLFEERTVQLSSGVAQSMGLSKSQQPVSVQVQKVTPFSAIPTGFQWQMTLDGQLQVLMTFSPAPASGKVDVSLAIHY